MRARTWLAPLLQLALGCGDPTASEPPRAPEPAPATPPPPPASPPPTLTTARSERDTLRDERQRLRTDLVEVDTKLATAVVAVAKATTDRDLTVAKLAVARLQRRRAELQIHILKIDRLLQPPHGPPYRPPRHIDPECLKHAFSPRCR